jgi:hypothetical protein
LHASYVPAGFVAALVVVWPAAWLLASVYLVFSGQWLRIAKVCLLIPLWAIAPLMALIELGPYIPAPDAPEPDGSAMSLLRLIVAAVTSFCAWWLLVAWIRGKQLVGWGRDPDAHLVVIPQLSDHRIAVDYLVDDPMLLRDPP